MGDRAMTRQDQLIDYMLMGLMILLFSPAVAIATRWVF